MSDSQEITYVVDFRTAGTRRGENSALGPLPAGPPVPRIARLLALAHRFDGLLRDGTIRDFAELARLGRVTRARITQIMNLLDLAPDIQEQILFLPAQPRLNERNLRPLARVIDWDQQRRRFRNLTKRFDKAETRQRLRHG